MAAPIIIAVIGGICGIAGAVISALFARRQVRFQSTLEAKRDIDKARRDYEYEARKRLYSAYEPLKFQLVDLVGLALRRVSILSLAPPACGSVEHMASVYELLAPLALVRMMDRNLTLVDMNLEHQVSVEYGFIKAAYRVLADSETVASIYSTISSDFRRAASDEGVLPYQLDEATDALLGISSEDSGVTGTANRQSARLMTFHEFRNFLGDASNASRYEGLEVISQLLDGFSPSSRPVFWCCLVTQVLLYGSYLDLVLRSPSTDSKRLKNLAVSLIPQLKHALDAGIRLDKYWMSAEHPSNAEINSGAVQGALPCAVSYYRLRVLPAVDLTILTSPPQSESTKPGA